MAPASIAGLSSGEEALKHRDSFMADQRGAVAFEMPIVIWFLMFLLLLPLADLGIAALQFVSAWEALHTFGQYLQSNPPPDVTNTSVWMTNALKNADPRYPISSIQLKCGVNYGACSNNTVSPKYYIVTTTFTVSPMSLLKPVLCNSGNANPCSLPLSYSEMFQDQ
jgi:Flp pilus assembly protein TadG